MSCWYYSSDEIELRTPSREDGVPLGVESRYRRDGARFIINASNTLGLRYETPATGVVFFHRFFMIQSFKQFNRWVVAAACLLLAGKVEENPKKCRDVLKVTQSILTEQQMSNFGSNPKEELLTHERILLQTIKFDLQVEHPYSYLLQFAKCLKGDKQKMEKLVQTASTFVNDSLSTVLCLQWEPQAIAVAFLYLAGKLAKYDLQSITQSKSRSWWRQFVDNLDVHDLDTICHQVLDTYGEAADNSSASQDEDENEPLPVTPQQMPPSTASIPPSVSVIPSGGVGHTASTHLPLPSLQAQGQSQMLTQLIQLPPRPSPTTRQLVQSPQFALATLQAATLSSVGSTVAARPPQLPNPYQTFQGVLLRQQGATVLAPPTHAPLIATPQGLSTLNFVMGGTSLQQPQTMLLLQQQQQQLQALQQQARIQRGLATLPGRTGASEITPPPAKRHAMEYRPGLPQLIHQLSPASAAAVASFPPQPPTNFPPQPPTNFPQQLNSPHPLGMLGGMTLTPPPSAVPPAQLRPTIASPLTMPTTGYTGRTAHWQQQK